MTDESDATPPLRRPLSRRRRIGVAAAALIVVALFGLWLVRKPIAEHYVDGLLARSRVPARYDIADLGLGRQRLTNVVIGDPAVPDLVADWIETETSIGLSGATLSGVRAGHVRLRGRLVDGRVTLGAIDRLLPPSSGKPFALPAFGLTVDDGRMRLETPYGVVGLALTGAGRLDNGFDGRLALVGDRIAATDCAATGVSAVLRVRTATRTIRLDGPARSRGIACGGVTTGALRSDADARLTTADTLGWALQTRLAIDDVRHALGAARSIAGTVSLQSGATIAGPVALTARGVRGFGATAGSLVLAGNVAAARGRLGYRGTVALADARADGVVPATLADVSAGTPVAPLARQVALALRSAAGRFGGSAAIDVARDTTLHAHVSRLSLGSTSGVRAEIDGGDGIDWTSAGGLLVDGTATIAGGGLPQLTARLVQKQSGTPLRGVVTMQPYAAGGSRLALTPLAFTAAAGGATRITTVATLSGPIGTGRVDGLSLPIDARWDGRTRLQVNPVCASLAVDRLAVSGLVLDPAWLVLCPTGGALVSLDGGNMSGGARIGAARLGGRLGTTPLQLAATGAEVRLGTNGFVVRGVQAALGAPFRQTRLDFTEISGTLAGGDIAGRFAGGTGQFANVPLLLGGAAGDWTLHRGALALTGTMTVADAAPTPRFQTLDARGVALTLHDGAIAASATLVEPTRTVKVADVTIRHALGSGVGAADLTVPGLVFTKQFQPDLLTRLTFGVIAEVRGTVTGEGHIGWSPAGVTSTGRFATTDTDLAAAFGPVTGISGTIRFTDLLALESAPGQVATIATINPGIPVKDGTITYQTYPGSRILVNGGRWPFAGGTLTLDPTLLDFSAAQARRMTFHVDGAAADQFLQQFDFKNLDATGIFDGVLPMIFDEAGGRIEGGRLAVRAGGGGLAYVGDLTQKDLGFWGNLAFGALKSLRYRNLSIVMNGPLAGEMVTEVRFAGISQGKGAKSNFLIRRLQKLPFVFNIRIKAPFRGLLDSAQSFYDPSRLIQRNLPQLLERQRQHAVPPIQPPESEKLP